MLLPTETLLKIDSFTFEYLVPAEEFSWLGSWGRGGRAQWKQAGRQTGEGGTKWIASGQNIPFSSSLGFPPRSLDSVWLVFFFLLSASPHDRSRVTAAAGKNTGRENGGWLRIPLWGRLNRHKDRLTSSGGGVVVGGRRREAEEEHGGAF